MNTVYAPGSLTTDETFLWYRVDPRLELGLAYLSKQGAFRALASYRLSPETLNAPSVSVSAGVQGIGTGNPGYSGTLEKNWQLGTYKLNTYGGIGVRSNENRLYPVGGVKLTDRSGVTLGVQHDGIVASPFVTYSHDRATIGFYLVGAKNPAYLVGFRF